MDFFTDDAVVKLEPPPPEGGSYNGKEQIRDFVRDYIRDFHAESRDHRETEEGKMSWVSEVNAHPFGGLNPVEGMAQAALREGGGAGLQEAGDLQPQHRRALRRDGDWRRILS